MDKLNSQIKERYAQEAGTCSTLGCGNNLKFANLKPGEAVLDLGCGRGRETIEAALQVSSIGLAIGLDLTERMVKEAQKSAEEKAIENVSFVVGEIENLPFGDNFFDAVISNCVINHAKNKLRVYKEISRVLKPDGRLIISDIVALEELPPEIKNDEKAWADCFAGAEDKDLYFQAIHDAGFSSMDILNWREYKKQGYLIASVTFKANKQGGGKENETGN